MKSLKAILKLLITGSLFLLFPAVSHKGMHRSDRLILRLLWPDSHIHGPYYEYFENLFISLYIKRIIIGKEVINKYEADISENSPFKWNQYCLKGSAVQNDHADIRMYSR